MVTIQFGKTLRFLPREPTPDDSTSDPTADTPETRLKQLGLLEHTRSWVFSYDVEWSHNTVSIDFFCRGKTWTKGRVPRRTQEGLGLLEVFLEALGIPASFQTTLDADRERLVEHAPFIRDANGQPLYAVALVGQPSSRRPVGATDIGNSLTDLVLQCINGLHYGLLQVLFKGTKLPKSCFVQPFVLQNHNRSYGLNNMEGSTRHQAFGYRREPSPRDQHLELQNWDYFQTGAFMAEVRLLLVDSDASRLLAAQANLIPLLRHYDLKVSRYPCWYRLNRLSTVLPAFKHHYPLAWQRLTGRRLMQLVRFPMRNYPGFNRLTPSDLLAFEPPLPTPAEGVSIPLGNPILDGREITDPYCLPISHLSTHLGVWGETGSGKSRFVYGLVRDLAHQGYSITLFDPKGEYGPPLCNEGLLDRLVILRPGSDSFPFQLNMLEVPKGVSVEDHIGFLHSTLMNLFDIQDIEVPPQMEAVFFAALRYAVEHELTFDGLLDLLEWPEEKLITKLHVQGTKLTWSALAIANRLRVLTYGVIGEVFVGETTIKFDKLLDKVCILDLKHLEDAENVTGRKILIEVFTHYLLNHLRIRHSSIHQAGGIEHIIVVKESQKLVPQKIRPIYSDEQTLLGKLPWTLRGYGVACIYAGTEPLVETPILHNTGMTVMFYSKYDPEVLSNLLGLDTEDYLAHRKVQRLLGHCRYAFISQKAFDEIFLLKVKDVPLNESPVGEAELYRRLQALQPPAGSSDAGQSSDHHALTAKLETVRQRIAMVQTLYERVSPALTLPPDQLASSTIKQALDAHQVYGQSGLTRKEQARLFLQHLNWDITPEVFWGTVWDARRVNRLEGQCTALERKLTNLGGTP